MSKRVYTLPTGAGIFFDAETGLKVLPKKQVEINKDEAGEKTILAIMSGGLLEVVETKTSKSKETTEPNSAKDKGSIESDLPVGFPGRDVFVAAGMNLQAVREFDFVNSKVPGVGKGTIEALKKFFEDEAQAK